MAIPRIYQAVPLISNQTLTLDEHASHHLAVVLRSKVGEKVIIFNGQGGEFNASIKSMNKKSVVVEVNEFHSIDRESPLKIVLVQGIARGEKMDFIIQKAVELGVNKIIPLITEYGNVRLAPDRLQKKCEHWRGVIVSACEQSGRTVIPELELPITLAKWLDQPLQNPGFYLSPDVAQDFGQEKLASKLTICIGPEGGFSQKEEEAMQIKGLKGVKMGPRILRTETAGICAISILQARHGDMCLTLSSASVK